MWKTWTDQDQLQNFKLFKHMNKILRVSVESRHYRAAIDARASRGCPLFFALKEAYPNKNWRVGLATAQSKKWWGTKYYSLYNWTETADLTLTEIDCRIFKAKAGKYPAATLVTLTRM